jgi:hypothetical protein
MHFKPQKLDIKRKKRIHHLSSASIIRYRQAEVLAKVLLSINILILHFIIDRKTQMRSHFVEYCLIISSKLKTERKQFFQTLIFLIIFQLIFLFCIFVVKISVSTIKMEQ